MFTIRSYLGPAVRRPGLSAHRLYKPCSFRSSVSLASSSAFHSFRACQGRYCEHRRARPAVVLHHASRRCVPPYPWKSRIGAVLPFAPPSPSSAALGLQQRWEARQRSRRFGPSTVRQKKDGMSVMCRRLVGRGSKLCPGSRFRIGTEGSTTGNTHHQAYSSTNGFSRPGLPTRAGLGDLPSQEGRVDWASVGRGDRVLRAGWANARCAHSRGQPPQHSRRRRRQHRLGSGRRRDGL